ncbi:MAG TPA: hypothetical protein PKC21_00225 [Oligoflexia bacterium]|nr:hypothetical protein [Oligoflexia bacterium]HMR23752.1 hypothetical protein [Oligoflexia bacterium]
MSFKKKDLYIIVLCLSIVAACSQAGVESLQRTNPVLMEGTQIGLLIDQNNGVVMIDGITVAEGSSDISSALDVLLDSGLNVVIHDNGPLDIDICAIGSVGQPENDCLGDSQDRQWLLFYKKINDNVWTLHQSSSAEYQISDGDLIAFVWTAYDMNSNPILVPDNAWVLENFF